MDNKFIIERVEQVQKRLNILISLAVLGKIITWLGAIAGLILIAVCRLGLLTPWNAWPIWAAVLVVITLFGYFWSRTKHLKLYDTARWLDGRFHDHEALSAAMVCLERPTDEVFDQAVLDRAVRLLNGQSRIAVPLRRTMIWLSGALLTTLIVMVAFFFLPGDFRTMDAQSGPDRMKNVLRTIVRKHGNEKELNQTPKTMAERLFPHNPRMARRLEKALDKGDTAELEKLLKEAKWDTDLMANRETASAENPRAQSEKETMQQKMLEMAKGLSIDGKNKRKGKKPGTQANGQQIAGDQNGDSQNRQRSNDSQKGKGSRFTPGKEKEKIEGERRSQMANAGQGKQAQAGKGNHSVGKRWGNLDGATAPQTALITSKKNSPMLEYVMPNKGSRVPLAQTAPQAGRTAESAISKENLPGEYESFVRSYFLKLTKTANGASHQKK